MGSGTEFVSSENAFVWIDGIFQRANIDYTFNNTTTFSEIILTTSLPVGAFLYIYVIPNISNGLFARFTFTGDGVEDTFPEPAASAFNIGNQTEDTTMVFLDGVFQDSSKYTVVSDPLTTRITFDTAPAVGVFVHIILATDPTLVSTNDYSFLVSEGFTIDWTGITGGTLPTGIEAGATFDASTISTTYRFWFDNGSTIAPVVTTEILVAIPFLGIEADQLISDLVVAALLGADVDFANTTNSGTTLVTTTLVSGGSAIDTADGAPSTNAVFTVITQGTVGGDGVTTAFVLADQNSIAGESTMVFLDGVLQIGPWDNTPPPDEVWEVSSPNTVLFSIPPSDGVAVSAFTILGGVGIDPTAEPVTSGFANNLGNISASSLLVQYLGEDVPLFVEDVLRTPDGYVDENGLEVIPADTDNSGFTDNPFLFKDIVLQDGFTDLVLWRKIEQFGFSVFDPIGIETRPRGTYGLSTQGDILAGEVISTNFTNLGSITGIPEQVLTGLPITAWTVLEGDIHYNISTNTWLVADVLITGMWIVAPDQTIFKFEIGRANLKFMWLHFAPDAFRIDPSVSNVMDAYILTTAFDDAFRTALFNNTPTENLPEEPSSEELRIQFADFENFKAMSDAIIYHTARYKILFGQQAIPALQATFKVIQTEGSLLSENDLRLRILETIDLFFSVDNFDFGETFYMTELLAFIHQELATNIQSVVAVPKQDEEAFGRLFQIRAEPDQLFISSASAEDIELVTAFTDEELRIGTIV
jgi:hypothetical protein